MMRFGKICELDLDKYLARVYFEEDDFPSGWLKISVPRSMGSETTFPFDINEPVWCVFEDERCEHGVIGGAYYTEENKPEGAKKDQLKIKFADNSTIIYDRSSRALMLDIKGDVSVKCEKLIADCSGNAEIKADNVEITAIKTSLTGILEVTGNATIKGMALVGGLGSATPGVPIPTEPNTELTIEKISATNVVATDDVKAGSISVKMHKHISAASGSPTSTPQ